MLHVCVQKFDVTSTLEFLLEQGLSLAQNCCARQLLELQNCQQTAFLADNFFCRLIVRKIFSSSMSLSLQPCFQLYNLFTGPLFLCHVELSRPYMLPAAIVCMHLEFPVGRDLNNFSCSSTLICFL